MERPDPKPLMTVQRLAATKLLGDAVTAGKLKIVGARYSLDSGGVELLA